MLENIVNTSARVIGTDVVKETVRLVSVNRWTGPPHWAR